MLTVEDWPAGIWVPQPDGTLTAAVRGDEGYVLYPGDIPKVNYYAPSGAAWPLTRKDAEQCGEKEGARAFWRRCELVKDPEVTPKWIRNHIQTRPLVRHLKRRTVYTLDEIAVLQMSGTEHDDRELVLYRDVRHGIPWVRPIEDFAERFEVAGPDVGWARAGNVWHAATRPAGSTGRAWTLCSRGVVEGDLFSTVPQSDLGLILPRCRTCQKALDDLKKGGDW